MNMIEKVARAIFASQDWKEFSPAFEHQADVVWLPAAKAAIEAMSEPTEWMKEEWPPEPYMDDDVWCDIINAALEEK